MQFFIDSMAPQKDQYRVKLAQGEKDLIEADFVKGPWIEAELLRFKRFIMHGRVLEDGLTHEVRIEIDMRGGIVTTELAKHSRELDSKDVMNGLSALAEDWSHASRRARHEDRPVLGPLIVTETLSRTKDQPQRTYAVVDNAEWFAGVLHMVRARTRERGLGVELRSPTRRDFEQVSEEDLGLPRR